MGALICLQRQAGDLRVLNMQILLLENSSKMLRAKPWFKDTVFIFVADHTAGAGGKIELSTQKYHIPAIFYSPGFINPQDYHQTASQIDIAPTLLSLLNFSYYTKFFGEDIFLKNPKEARAFISNYQKIAYLKNGQLTVLEPKKKGAILFWRECNAIYEC